MDIEVVEYRGWQNNLALRNKHLEVIVTLDVGPRIISCRLLPGGENVMKNYDEQMGGTGESTWNIRGGHRIWIAPEDCTRTYYPDNRPVEYERIGDSRVRFQPPPEKMYDVQKTLEVELVGEGNHIDVTTRVTNIGTTSKEYAAWGPTVMAPGGVEIIPLPWKFPHPGNPLNARGPADFAPNQELILWPFFDFADTRWSFGSKYILLRQDAKKGPTKLGLAHRAGWVGYLNRGTLFVKRFDHDDFSAYPDRGTNYQTFSNEDMLEMETVAPLGEVFPGDYSELNETWQLFACAAEVKTDVDVEAKILPLVSK